MQLPRIVAVRVSLPATSAIAADVDGACETFLGRTYSAHSIRVQPHNRLAVGVHAMSDTGIDGLRLCPNSATCQLIMAESVNLLLTAQRLGRTLAQAFRD